MSELVGEIAILFKSEARHFFMLFWRNKKNINLPRGFPCIFVYILVSFLKVGDASSYVVGRSSKSGQRPRHQISKVIKL